MIEAAMAALAALAVLLGGWALSEMLHRRNEKRAVLAQRLQTVAGLVIGDEHRGGLLKDTRLSRIPWLDRILVHLPGMMAYARAVRQAGFEDSLTAVLLAPTLVGGSIFVLFRAAGSTRASALFVGLIAWAVPILIVQRRRRARARAFGEQLPDALDLMRAALQAGHSFVSAIMVVAEEFPDPSATEFRQVAEEMRLGLSLREALGNLCARLDNADLPILMVGVLVAQESGGNLAEVLENISHTVRERFKLGRELQVLTAQGRMSSNVLTGLPILLGGALMAFSPQYFKPMLEDPRGTKMLLFAAGSLVCGQLMMRRIVRMRF